MLTKDTDGDNGGLATSDDLRGRVRGLREPCVGVPPAAAGDAGRRTHTFIAERDSGHIDDEVLRSVLHGLDLEEATLIRI
jgi:hypothetical protein